MMTPRPLIVALISLLAAACNGEIYLRGGVTDGDTFYLSQRALVDDGPALQSWVRYSLAMSTCQLKIGDDNPAHASSYACELMARQHLLDAWREKKGLQPQLTDAYLDDLVAVDEAGFLEEHVARHFHRRGWSTPDHLQSRQYRRWLARHMPDHEPETRWTGSWNYADKVSAK